LSQARSPASYYPCNTVDSKESANLESIAYKKHGFIHLHPADKIQNVNFEQIVDSLLSTGDMPIFPLNTREHGAALL
jgi:hypothetical protein